MKMENLPIVFLCGISFFVSIHFLLSFEEVGWDAAHYLKIAEYWQTGNVAFKELKWSDLEFKIPTLSPLLSFLEYLIFLVFGVNTVAVKFFYSIFLPLLVFSVYKLTGLVENKKTGLVAAFLIFMNPLIVFWSTRLYTDVPAIALYILGLYLLLKSNMKNLKSYFISGIVFGLAFLMRIPLATYGILIIVLYLILNKKLNWKSLGLLSLILPFIPWLIYLQTEKIGLLEAFSSYSEPFVAGARNPIKNLFVFANSTGPVWIILTAVGILIIEKLKDLRILAFVISLLLFLSMPFGDERYTIPAVVFSSIIISSIDLKKIGIPSSLFLIILLLIVFYNVPILLQNQTESIYCSKNSALVKIGEFLQRNSETDTIVFAENYWPEIEFYSKRDTYAMIEEKPWLDYLIQLKRTKFIILENNQTKIKYLENFSFIKEFEDNCKKLYLYGRRI